MSTNQPIIEINNVTFSYDKEKVLDNVSLDVHDKDFLGLVGPNGGGKTTLLKLVLGLLQPQSGTIRVLGQAPQNASSQIGYVAQLKDLEKSFPISVLEVVLLGLLNKSSFFMRYSSEDKQKALEALQKTDLHDLRDRPFGTLSGGQRQRALIARALVGNPQLLIMDEPTSNVDSWSQHQIYELLNQLNRQCTIILVSHDLGVVSRYVKRVACLNRKIVLHPTKEITGETIEELYRTPLHLINHELKIGS